MTKFLSWLANLFVLSPFLREKQKAMRQSWPLAAAHLDLVFSPGRNLYDDKITGILDGYPVAIYNEFDLDVQKLVTLIRVFSEGVLSTSKNLSRKELLAQYDKSVETCGALSDGMLSEDQRAWFLGHRRGIGTERVEGDLVYRQLYGMDEAEEIILVAKAMVLTVRQLAWKN